MESRATRTVEIKSGGISIYLGYSISIISLCTGIVLLAGIFIPTTIPSQLRMMVGIVFVLMSMYRFVATRYKIREQQRDGQ